LLLVRRSMIDDDGTSLTGGYLGADGRS
jgi:hypothetical protein